MNSGNHDGLRALAELEPLWSDLAQRGGVRTPFQSFAWIEEWVRHRGHGLEPFFLVVQDGTTLAPLGRLRLAGSRVVCLLGAKESDYTGLVSLTSPREAWDAVIQELAKRRKSWDLLHFHSVDDSEAILTAMARHIGPGAAQRVYDECPIISTDVAWDALLRDRKKIRYEVRRWRRRLEEAGEVSIQVETPPLEAELINALEEVERASWKWGSGESAFRAGGQRDFVEGFLRNPRGSFRLWLLRLSGELVAFAVVLVAGSRWYYYLPSFRQECAHAGSYLLARLIQEACEGDCDSVDLLRGLHTYKCAWTDRSRPVHEIVCPSNSRGKLVTLAYQARWKASRSQTLKGLRQRLTRTGDRR